MPAPASLKYADLKALLKSGEPLPPVTLLIGPEPFFKDEAVLLIVGELDRRCGGALTKVGVDGGSTELESIPATHFTTSLFGGEKLVVIRGFDKARAADRKAFLSTVGECTFPETLRLVIVSEELKATAPELKSLRLLAVTFWVPFQSDLMKWIGERLAQHGIRASRSVPEMLYRMHGKAVPWKTDLEVDLFRLAGSIERLGRHASGASGAQALVDEATVALVLGRGAPPDVFALVELIGRRDRARAIRDVRAFLEDSNESPIGLVALLLDRFEKLIRVNSASRQAVPAAWQDAVRKARAVDAATRSDVKRTATSALSAALSSLGGAASAVLGEIKDYQKPALVLQADKYAPEELTERFTRLVELDRKLKSGGGDERAEMELFVAGI